MLLLLLQMFETHAMQQKSTEKELCILHMGFRISTKHLGW